MHMIRKWTIRTQKTFVGISELGGAKYILYKNEQTPVTEMDITELRKLKEFFDEWIDPFEAGNSNHSDNQK